MDNIRGRLNSRILKGRIVGWLANCADSTTEDVRNAKIEAMNFNSDLQNLELEKLLYL